MSLILSVTELTRRIRDLLEGRLGEVWVEGEISNYRKQSSGHHYFTLKDDRSQIACVLFARAYSAQAGLTFADGLRVQVYGRISVYEARGQYQLVAELVQPKGVGALQAKFEALKRKLQTEGLFAESAKRKLPRYPQRIALVTSPSGAAIQDMLNILGRRSPWLRILICPVRVQGDGAAEEIAGTIDYLNRFRARYAIDAMIVGRGGGSLEDLWEFNEEALARAIFRSEIPIVSAVGHEIDYSIADLVADVRAPTPSAAAELISPDQEFLNKTLERFENVLRRLVTQQLEFSRLRLQRLAAAASLTAPRRVISERQQHVDQLEAKLNQARTWFLHQRRDQIRRLSAILLAYHPREVLRTRRATLVTCSSRFQHVAKQQLEHCRLRLQSLRKSLVLLGPQQTLERGYSITQRAAGEIVHQAGDVVPGEQIVTLLADGQVTSTVEKTGPSRLTELPESDE
jgi:exodeoxyribonuclease VII large subunit